MWTVSQNLEDTVAEALDRLSRADRAQMRRICHQERHDPAAVHAIDQLEGVDAHLPAELRVPSPDAADPHHGLQRDLCRQLAQRPHARSIGLLECEDGKAPLIPEVNRHQRPAHIRRGAGHQRW